jgi:putative ABC transport system substrate-binding protein
MKRREFVALLGGAAAAACPFAARAERPGIPVIGCVHSGSAGHFAQFAPAISQGLGEGGYVDGRDVAIQYRFAEGDYEKLAILIADLIDRRVAVIIASGGTAPAIKAKAATSTIAVVFVSAADPIKTGLVPSLSRPGGNITGVSLIGSALEAKRLGLLHEVTPGAAIMAALINPDYPDAQSQKAELEAAAGRIGVQLIALTADTPAEINAALARFSQSGASGLLVAQDPFFGGQSRQIVALAAPYRMPAIYGQKKYVAEGGLISYGPHFFDGYRQAGLYAARILKGEKAADLPIVQPTKFELIINLTAAKSLGVTIPPMLLTTADEVIE